MVTSSSSWWNVTAKLVMGSVGGKRYPTFISRLYIKLTYEVDSGQLGNLTGNRTLCVSIAFLRIKSLTLLVRMLMCMCLNAKKFLDGSF